MAKRDYYEILGVSRDATADALKKAYRKLAMQYHPDRNPGDKAAEARFKEINEAYDVLKDDDKRAAYDRFGHRAFEGGGPGAGDPFAGFRAGPGGGLGDIFDEIFSGFGGARRGGSQSYRGQDIQTAVEISLEEAFAGTKVEVRVPTRVKCDACSGTGSEDGKVANDTCPTCGGTGKMQSRQGFFLIERTCPTCGGAGRVVRNPCKVCHGAGTVQRERTLAVQIPAGVDDGTRIRIAGEGAAGTRGAPSGDLYVDVSIRAHPLFQRDGANVYCRVPVRMAQAALGVEVEVPAIDGSRARVKIPAGTQTGDQFRLRGKGFSVLRSAARGDMYIQVTVETPQNLTRRQRELLEEFEKEAKTKSSPESEGFFSKVREFFESKG